MTNTPMEAADLDSTIAALQSGVTAIAPDAALSVIAGWQQQLQDTEIGTLLDELKVVLSGTSSHRSIEAILSELAAQTTSAAGNAGGDLGAKLAVLGRLLSEAGSSLS